jgi:alpha-tubulin suppressor-like RCC1 family protein
MRFPVLLAYLICQSFLALSAEPLTAGAVIGWGYNISGEATGIPSGRYSTNLAVFASHIRNRQSLYATGLVMIGNQCLTDAVAISSGGTHSLALKADGAVVGWGNNMSGRAVGIETEEPYWTNGLVQVDGHILTNVVAISACQYSVALKRDGTVVVWGRNASGQKIIVPATLTNVAAIATGEDSSMALKHDGVATLWGCDGTDKSFILPGFSNLVAVAMPDSFFGFPTGLKNDGTVIQWDKQKTITLGLSNVTAIAAGSSHYLAVRKDGTVVEWGTYDNGASGGSAANTAVDYPIRAVKTDGQILSNVVAIATAKNNNMALKNDGTVVTWGGDSRSMLNVPAGLSNVVAIAAGNNFCIAITTNAAVADKFRH